jgi:hypothetical protein
MGGKMKRITLFLTILLFGFSAWAQTQPEVVMEVNVSEINNSKNIYQGYPTHGGELPVSHIAPSINIPGQPLGLESAQGFYTIRSLLGIKDSYTGAQMWRVWGGEKVKRSAINNIMGFEVNVHPNSRLRIIESVPENYIFIPVGEYNNSDKKIFKTPLHRVSFQGLWALSQGGNVLKFGWEGVGNAMTYNKLDTGGSGALMKGDLDVGKLINAFLSGGTGGSEQVGYPWLGLYGGRLFHVDQVREAYKFWDNLYKKSGYNPSFLEIDFSYYAQKHGLEGNRFLKNDIETLLIREYVISLLFKVEIQGQLPEILAEKEEPEKEVTETTLPVKERTKDDILKDAQYAQIFILFDFDRYDLRSDQIENAKKAGLFGYNFGAEFCKAGKPEGAYIILAGHADFVGSNDYNLSLAQKRGGTLKHYVAEGMRNVKNEQGQRLITEEEIDKIIVVYSGSNINPLTDEPMAKAEKERAAFVWVKGVRLYNPERS